MSQTGGYLPNGSGELEEFSLEFESANKRYRRSDRVAFRQVADEILIVPIRSEPSQKVQFFSLNPTAARLWVWLERERDLDQLTRLVCDHYEVSADRARADVEACCRQLLDLGAIEVVGQAASDP